MTTVITVLILLASIFLILTVLVQKSKGGGLASNFSSSNAVMGVRKTTDLLEKTTWGLAGFIMVMCIVCVMVAPKTSSSNVPAVGAPKAPESQSLPADFSTTTPSTTTLPPAPAQQPAPQGN